MSAIAGKCSACREDCWLIDHPTIAERIDWSSDGGIMCNVAQNTLHSVPKTIGLPKAIIPDGDKT